MMQNHQSLSEQGGLDHILLLAILDFRPEVRDIPHPVVTILL